MDVVNGDQQIIVSVEDRVHSEDDNNDSDDNDTGYACPEE
jgi:hypothetical protein